MDRFALNISTVIIIVSNIQRNSNRNRVAIDRVLLIDCLGLNNILASPISAQPFSKISNHLMSMCYLNSCYKLHPNLKFLSFNWMSISLLFTFGFLSFYLIRLLFYYSINFCKLLNGHSVHSKIELF